MAFDLERMRESERERFGLMLQLVRRYVPSEISHIQEERTALVVVDDFEAALREFAGPEEVELYEIYGWPLDLNAITLISRDAVARFKVVLKRHLFENDAYQHTVPHELTHVSDYTFFFGTHGNVYAASEAEQEASRFWAYYHWSEFHAKAVGTKLYAIAKKIEQDGELPANGSYGFAVEFRTQELARTAEVLENSRARGLAGTNEKFWAFMLELMAYLGRMSVFQPVGSTQPVDPAYPEDVWRGVFGPALSDLYGILLKMKSPEEAERGLEELHETIRAVANYLNVRTVHGGLGME